MDDKSRLLFVSSKLLWRGSLLDCMLGGIPPWTLHLGTLEAQSTFRFTSQGRYWSLALANITDVGIEHGLLWSRVFITTIRDERLQMRVWRWSAKELAASLRREVTVEVRRLITHAEGPLAELEAQAEAFLSSDRYLRVSDIAHFRKAIRSSSDAAIKRLAWLLRHPYAKDLPRSELARRAQRINAVQDAKSQVIRDRNAAFVASELNAFSQFFDQVEKTPLTNEQRKAAVIFEDRNLLVAAAGSGKSSTLVGKAAYALKRELFASNEIVALAFNKKAALELNERIHHRISPWLPGAKIKARTFHGLGYFIVRDVARRQGREVRLARESTAKIRLQAVRDELLRQSTEFASDWVHFLSMCREPIPADDAFESKQDYDDYVDRQRAARRKGQPASFQALSGDVVRSGQELAIANWLYMQGIPFVYEKPFMPVPKGWTKYEPDFYFPDIDGWYEHFALDASGAAPSHFPNYAEQACEKRAWMQQHAPGRFLETQSHQYYDSTLFSCLKGSLLKLGQKLRPRSAEETLAKIRSLNQSDSLDLILKVLNLVKSNDIDEVEFNHCMRRLRDQVRAVAFTKVFWPLFEAYNRRLQDEGRIDFNDMIIRAAKVLESDEGEHLPKLLLLVDEFQDLSVGRARFIKALLGRHHESVLFGVGDDWQAINGFAGSDLKLFMNFESHFGATHEGVLTKTFRCPQGIADVGANFIQKNSGGQKSKQVKSELDPTVNGVINLLDIANDDKLGEELDRQLSELAREKRASTAVDPNQGRYSVLLLSRYKLNNTMGIDDDWIGAITKKYGDALDIDFMTMHKSKGLEADYVFLLGLNAGAGLTFPSSMVNDPLVDALLQNNDDFPHAEERRLFYVALTRAKRRCFVLFRRGSPSPFVLELMGSEYAGRVQFRGGDLPPRCSRCGKGFMVPRPGKPPFLGCTRYPVDDCRNTQSLNRVSERIM